MDTTQTLVMTPQVALQLATEAAGGQSRLAKICDRTQGAISKLIASGRPLWAESVLNVEAATGVSRHDLRPDIYPRDLAPAPESAGVGDGETP